MKCTLHRGQGLLVSPIQSSIPHDLNQIEVHVHYQHYKPTTKISSYSFCVCYIHDEISESEKDNDSENTDDEREPNSTKGGSVG